MAENTTRSIKDLSFTEADRFRITQQNGFLGVTKPVHHVIYGTSAATAANYSAPFFIADRSYEIISITEASRNSRVCWWVCNAHGEESP